MKLYHISDLHICEGAKRNGIVRSKLQYITKSIEPGDLVVVTGDIVSDGTPGQYEQAQALLAPFKGRIVLVPGNHDMGLGGVLFDPACVRRFAALRAALGDTGKHLFSVGGRYVGEVIVLDTTLRTGSVLDFSQGRVGWWHRLLLRRRLAAMRRVRAVSVVALHHSPYYQNYFLRLRDAQRFLNVVLGQADYVLMGHEHRVRHEWFPPHQSEGRAQTHLFGADALFKADAAVTVIPLPTEMDERWKIKS